MATKPKYAGVTPIEGGFWQYRIKLKLDNGKVVDTRIKKDINGQPFLKAVDAYEAKKAHELRLKTNPSETASEPQRATLRDVYNSYLNTEAKEKAASTLRKQDSMWRNHIEPLFADKCVDDITIVDLKSFLVNMYEKYSYKYTEAFLKFFYLLYAHADRLEVVDPYKYKRMFVTRNIRLEMPQMTQTDYEEDLEGATIYTDEELKQIKKVFESEDGNLYTAFMLGLYCGLRISEAFAVRWSNIDFENHRIKIDRQMQYDGVVTLCAVKTLKSVRSVLIPSVLWEELDFKYSYQIHQKQQLGNAYRDTEKVYDDELGIWIESGDFVNRKKNGELLTVNSMKYWSKKIKQETGIDFKYHNLRHTYATSLASRNCSCEMLQSLLGHKKIDTTRKYYINTENNYLINHTKRILEQMYDLEDNLIVKRDDED